ncbi:hypothetical protein A1O3_03696 [Capronia epimyces CBS 606.96]|uniref:Rhodopsin domain-containing protein n=1 Tax=Capronia epimyces CBS 606.96 TaxID=1182542 RepID=W9Y1Q0_9EURO|nr:uncharacterized protein A1O3_03696 [Capronia epimyces CBS 606.96]EXJ86742.1 hypothetical protein A1O3_03696 [Capronia epimyces CBS 606.96]
MLASTDHALLATSLVLAVGTIVSVLVQLERQYKTVGWLNASKWFLIISAFFSLVMTSIVCAAAAKGLGASISLAEFEGRESLQKLLVAAFPPYFLCNMFVKHAWLTFYYGLARTRAQTWFIHLMQIIAAGFGISSVLVILMQCIPLRVIWLRGVTPPPTEHAPRCINLIAFFYANAIIMIVTDVVMYLLPMVLLRNVDMLKPHRWGVYALFAIGGLVVVASIMRLVAIVHVDRDGIRNGSNVSENYALVYLWAAVENHLGICAACAGAIKQKSISVFHRVKRSYSSLKSKSYRSSHAPSSPLAQAQSFEDRVLYERTDSLPESPSGLDKKSPQPMFEMHTVPGSPTKTTEYELSTPYKHAV